MINFRIQESKDYSLLEFELDGPMTPEELKKVDPPIVNTTKGVIISGRGPIWLYGYLVHEYHPTPWVATFDPRLGKGVIVASHVKGASVGDLVG